MSHEFAAPEKPRLEKWSAEENELKAMLGVVHLPPQTITAPEWRRYSARIAAGDERARTELAGRRLRLAYATAKTALPRMAGDGLELEDHFQHAVEGVFLGMDHYDPLKHPSLRKEIQWGIYNGLERHGGEQETGVYTAPVPRECLPELDDNNLANDAMEASGAVSLAKDILDQPIADLSEREQLVLEVHYGLDGQKPRTLTAIGMLLGVNRQRTHYIERRALGKLAELPQVQALREPEDETVVRPPTKESAVQHRIDETPMAWRGDATIPERITEEDDARVSQLAVLTNLVLYRRQVANGLDKVDKHGLLEDIEATLGLPAGHHINYARYVRSLLALERHDVVKLDRNQRGTVIKTVSRMAH